MLGFALIVLVELLAATLVDLLAARLATRLLGRRPGMGLRVGLVGLNVVVIVLADLAVRAIAPHAFSGRGDNSSQVAELCLALLLSPLAVVLAEGLHAGRASPSEAR
ncbi:MAG: hypothetical protein JNJ54_06665 [Myxococcaceae bacterium]|nr:hypothetical protein [Myxococcaceae bacterium]